MVNGETGAGDGEEGKSKDRDKAQAQERVHGQRNGSACLPAACLRACVHGRAQTRRQRRSGSDSGWLQAAGLKPRDDRLSGHRRGEGPSFCALRFCTALHRTAHRRVNRQCAARRRGRAQTLPAPCTLPPQLPQFQSRARRGRRGSLSPWAWRRLLCSGRSGLRLVPLLSPSVPLPPCPCGLHTVQSRCLGSGNRAQAHRDWLRLS